MAATLPDCGNWFLNALTCVDFLNHCFDFGFCIISIQCCQINLVEALFVHIKIVIFSKMLFKNFCDCLFNRFVTEFIAVILCKK